MTLSDITSLYSEINTSFHGMCRRYIDGEWIGNINPTLQRDIVLLAEYKKLIEDYTIDKTNYTATVYIVGGSGSKTIELNYLTALEMIEILNFWNLKTNSSIDYNFVYP